MKSKELEKILDLNDHSWIKVKKLSHNPINLPMEDYQDLLDHHEKETEFLINKCRELARNLQELYVIILPEEFRHKK